MVVLVRFDIARWGFDFKIETAGNSMLKVKFASNYCIINVKLKATFRLNQREN